MSIAGVPVRHSTFAFLLTAIDRALLRTSLVCPLLAGHGRMVDDPIWQRTTLSSRSIFARPDVQYVNPPGDDSEFGRDRERPATRRSLDHLVRAQQQRLRDREPERLRRLQIDHQLELRRLLHRQVRRPRAFEDLVDVDGGTVSPSAFAVFRLITSSKCVGCKTGISAGFAPLRTCPT